MPKKSQIKEYSDYCSFHFGIAIEVGFWVFNIHQIVLNIPQYILLQYDKWILNGHY